MPRPSPRARRWPSCRCCASRRSRSCRPRTRPTAAYHLARRRAGPRVHVARPDLRARGLRRGLVAHGARAVRGRHRKGDIVHNTFAYHLTPGGWILDSGARALGCAVIAAGPGNTEQQLDVIQYAEAHGLHRRAGLSEDPARQGQGGRQGRLLASRRRWSAAARCFPRCGRNTRRAASTTYQTYATADLGIIAYESPALEGMIVDEGVIVEIVRPGTGDPVPGG